MAHDIHSPYQIQISNTCTTKNTSNTISPQHSEHTNVYNSNTPLPAKPPCNQPLKQKDITALFDLWSYLLDVANFLGTAGAP